MEPLVVAAISSTVFGVVAALSAFVRELLSSRDRSLNAQVYQRAMMREVAKLEEIYSKLLNTKWFDGHYQVLGESKDTIKYLDQKIRAIFIKKMSFVQRYSQVVMKEALAIIVRDKPTKRKAFCDALQKETELEMQVCDQTLDQLQTRRTSVWTEHLEMRACLLAQENSQNEQLDGLYKRHIEVLEKVFVRYANDEALELNAKRFKTTSLLMGPLAELKQFFTRSSGISSKQMKLEKTARSEISELEAMINNGGKPSLSKPKKENSAFHPEDALPVL